ncbi:hypothetical protein HPB49_008364 [Dermacentor silvarum]|uniref:Uncharacterized protein n=1 Tax=Dermacentor silvarum TaxID=543639 RepID=A0ACB8CE50_DERSI|nr:hypothetical protein HPB49_008364 [Dermacentor silvarum]
MVSDCSFDVVFDSSLLLFHGGDEPEDAYVVSANQYLPSSVSYLNGVVAPWKSVLSEGKHNPEGWREYQRTLFDHGGVISQAGPPTIATGQRLLAGRVVSRAHRHLVLLLVGKNERAASCLTLMAKPPTSFL